METNEDVPQEFYDVVDQFINLANSLGKNWPRSRISATLLYAAARYNAFNWLFREVDQEQTEEEAIEFYSDQYEGMLRDNISDLRRSYSDSGDL